MVTVNKLLSITKTGLNARIGNHRKETIGDCTKYYYYSTAIVVVDNVNKTFTTDNGGYSTHSTIRAINAYKKELLQREYKAV